MESFFFTGIQQVGVGTVNLRKSWDWHIDMFGADLKILEDNTVAERMLPYTGNKPQRRHACITMNIQGGAGWEIWQYAERKPVECPFEISVGDLGILAAKIKSKNVVAFRNELSKKWKDCSEIETLPDGTLIEFVETHRIPIVKKLGWFIDLGKRNPKKPLPKFLYRLMALVSKEKSQQSYKN